MEIVAANLKEKKVTLRMTAMPKEWKTGDTSLQFYLSCDGGEKIAVDAAAGADHSFTAEKEIPFCEVAAVTAILQRGDMEYPSDLGETGVSAETFTAHLHGQAAAVRQAFRGMLRLRCSRATG